MTNNSEINPDTEFVHVLEESNKLLKLIQTIGDIDAQTRLYEAMADDFNISYDIFVERIMQNMLDPIYQAELQLWVRGYLAAQKSLM